MKQSLDSEIPVEEVLNETLEYGEWSCLKSWKDELLSCRDDEIEALSEKGYYEAAI